MTLDSTMSFLKQHKKTILVTVIIIAVFYFWWHRPLRKELESKVKQMHPSVRNRFRQFIREVEQKTGWRVEVVSAWRGWADSVRIWNTYPQVQACCLPGQDYHFFAMAADIVLHKNGQRLGNSSSRQAWENTGIRKIARKYGMQWGIDFNGYFDPVHFAYPWKDMKSLVATAKKRYGSLEKTPGNRMNLLGVKNRTWKVA